MAKPPPAVAPAVSLQEKDSKLAITWADPTWIPHLNAANIMEYFAQPSNPFYDQHCNNESIRMQRLSLDHLKSMTGLEYILAHVQDPILYVIKKQERKSPSEVVPIAVYYILAGTVYQAPDLWSVMNSRLLNTAHYLHSAASEMNSFVRYHPSSGYYWDIKNQQNGSKVSFAPLDPTRKDAEESGTAFQRKNVDGLLMALAQKYPPKPMPNTPHPFGPRVVKEATAASASSGPESPADAKQLASGTQNVKDTAPKPS